MERWTGSFPAGDVFSDPLYRRPSSSILPAQMAFEYYSEYEHSYRMGMLLEGPQDEHDLAELWRSPFDPPTNTKEIECGSYSPVSYDGMTIKTCDHVPPESRMVRHRRRTMPSAPPEEETPTTMVLGGEKPGNGEEDEGNEERREGAGLSRLLRSHRLRRPTPTTAPRGEEGHTSSIVDFLDHIPKRGSGGRGQRKRGTWKSGTWFLKHLLNTPCFPGLYSASIGQKRENRKNNEQWTSKEVKLLVKGVTECGVGHWTELKDRWFSDSVRTAVHIKDKWRNLVKAYVVRPTSKKKGRNKHLDRELINKIQMLAAKHPYPK